MCEKVAVEKKKIKKLVKLNEEKSVDESLSEIAESINIEAAIGVED